MAEETAKTMSQAFEDFFFSVIKGKFENAEDVFKSFTDAILRMALKAVSNQLVSNLLSSLGGLFGAGGGGGSGIV